MLLPVHRRALWVSLVLLVSALLSVILRPQITPAQSAIDLARLIPASFGDWREDPSIQPIEPAPGDQALIDRIYSQTLARAYVDSQGRQIMLSVAYGAAQSDSLRVHQPEVCYRSQGFEVTKPVRAALDTVAGQIPVMRFIASKPMRNEPVTYWMVIGEQPVRTGWEAKLVTLRYALSGVIPDGFLIRVSGIDEDTGAAFGAEQQFIQDLVDGIAADHRLRFVGSLPG